MLSGPKRKLWHVKIFRLSGEVIKLMVLNLKSLGEMSKQDAACENKKAKIQSG